MVRKKHIFRSFLVALIFSLELLYILVTLNICDINQVVFLSLGGGLLDSKSSPQSLIIFFIPFLFLFFLFSDFLSCDFDKMAVYVFTRTSKYLKYIHKKYLYLALCILLYTILCITFSLILGFCFGSSMNDLDMKLIINAGVLSFLQNFLIILCMNLLTLKIQPQYSFLLVSFIFLLFVFLTLFSNKAMKDILFYTNPFGQGFFAWHKESIYLIKDVEEIKKAQLPILYSYFYLVIIIWLEYLLLYKSIKRADFI